VTFVQNVTDVDDKIINRANQEGCSAAEIAEDYTAAFIAQMRELGIEDPTIRPLATQTIPAMIDLIERLTASDHAYAVGGDVYFSIRSFPETASSLGRDIDGSRPSPALSATTASAIRSDFALWKAAKPGEPHRTSPWGEGVRGGTSSARRCRRWSWGCLRHPRRRQRPIFPHHENERAIRSGDGKPFARYPHGGMPRSNQRR
jgi:cysteinyl-tRNA synthetase